MSRKSRARRSKPKQEGMVARAVTFPYSPRSMTWKEFRPIVTHLFQMAHKLANWTERELNVLDGLVSTEDGELQVPPFPHANLYGMGFTEKNGGKPMYPYREDWRGATRNASAVMQAVTDKYMAKRLRILTGAISHSSFNYPQPFPFGKTEWVPYYGKDNIPLVDLTLPQGKVTIQLRGGPEMRRQLGMFRQIVEEKLVRCQASLYRKRHGQRDLFKMIVKFPKKPKREGDKTMVLRTDSKALWTAEIPNSGENKTYIWNQDYVLRWIKAHDDDLQRVREDTKPEKRLPRKERAHIDRAVKARCDKFNARIASFCHKVTKELAGLADRKGVCHVFYDDSIQTWLPHFQWARLCEYLRYKLDDLGIEFVHVNDEDDDGAVRPEEVVDDDPTNQ